jgi:hypothetical protein
MQPCPVSQPAGLAGMAETGDAGMAETRDNAVQLCRQPRLRRQQPGNSFRLPCHPPCMARTAAMTQQDQNRAVALAISRRSIGAAPVVTK